MTLPFRTELDVFAAKKRYHDNLDFPDANSGIAVLIEPSGKGSILIMFLVGDNRWYWHGRWSCITPALAHLRVKQALESNTVLVAYKALA